MDVVLSSGFLSFAKHTAFLQVCDTPHADNTRPGQPETRGGNGIEGWLTQRGIARVHHQRCTCEVV